MIISLTGPSGIGKGFLTHAITTHLGASIIPWTTTRQPRPGLTEANRHFVSEAEFKSLERAGSLVGVQRMHSAAYALQTSLLSDTPSDVRICEVHIGNTAHIWPKLQSCFKIGLVTNDYALLQKRMRHRDPDITPTELADRTGRIEAEVNAICEIADAFDLLYQVTTDNEQTIAATVLAAIQEGADNVKTRN